MIGTLLAVDPGIRGSGVAFFKDSCLVDCAYVKNPEKTGHGPCESVVMAREIAKWTSGTIDILALEVPQVYMIGGGRTKGDANVAVLPLYGVDCALAALLPVRQIECWKPAEWKGQVNKEVTKARVMERLEPMELKAIGRLKGATAHNAIDAVAVGLKVLGRFERRRVFARE